MHIYQDFTEAYKGLLIDVYNNPDYVCSPRGQKIKEKLGVKFVIKNPLSRLPFLKERNFAINYIIAEALWYLSGNDSTEWISKYSAFWNKISDDGKTANSAYGARIFQSHPRAGSQIQFIDNKVWVNINDNWNQWQFIIDELVNDLDSRRAVIHIRSPYDSRYAKLDVPCTLTLQFFVRDEKLHLVVSMRSSDTILGIANDLPAFTLFQELMALNLSEALGRKIEVGEYIHMSNSLHIYERNFELVERIINEQIIAPLEMPKMPSNPPIKYLMEIESKLQHIDHSSSLKSFVEKQCVFQDYWNDWIKILASFRASKLNDKTLQEYLIKSTSWQGYHYFNR